jgi:hypothetical protein
MEFIKMNSEQRLKIIEYKLSALGMTINGWAKNNELDHRIVETHRATEHPWDSTECAGGRRLDRFRLKKRGKHNPYAFLH